MLDPRDLPTDSIICWTNQEMCKKSGLSVNSDPSTFCLKCCLFSEEKYHMDILWFKVYIFKVIFEFLINNYVVGRELVSILEHVICEYFLIYILSLLDKWNKT